MNNVHIYAIQPEEVVERAQNNLTAGFRLVQMHATTLPDGVEINYTYDLNSDLSVWRLAVAPQAMLASISAVYPAAFLYENEIHDLFDISFSDMSIDYHGNLYRLAVQTPFAPAVPKLTEQEGNNHA